MENHWKWDAGKELKHHEEKVKKKEEKDVNKTCKAKKSTEKQNHEKIQNCKSPKVEMTGKKLKKPWKDKTHANTDL